MSQSRKRSFIEAIANTAIGYSINFTANLIFLPLFFGIHVPLMANFWLGLIYTGISIARGFFVRRLFNRGDEKA